MESKDFDELAKEQFKFLKLDFECILSECKKENWGYELIYLNKTTAVKIVYEFREAYIFINLYQLVNGNLIDNPSTITANTHLHGYSLDDIITHKNRSALIQPVYQYHETSEYYDSQTGLALYVSAFANNLKEYGADILLGNFKIFSQLDSVVKDRASKYK
jgi:hypothetical protein